jgi:tripartite motif-containing protein 71
LRDGQFQRAIGIAIDAAGNVYVTDDGRPEIQVFDNDGNFLRKFGSRGRDDGQFQHPTGIAVDAAGNVYVSDYETKRVQKFDAEGNFLLGWGMAENSTGTPEGIAIDADGRLYITDYDRGPGRDFYAGWGIYYLVGWG